MARFRPSEGYALATRSFEPARHATLSSSTDGSRVALVAMHVEVKRAPAKRPTSPKPIGFAAPLVAPPKTPTGRRATVPLAMAKRLVRDFAKRQGCPLAVVRRRIDGELQEPEITGSRVAGLTAARVIQALDWHPDEAAERAWSWSRSFMRECADLRG